MAVTANHRARCIKEFPGTAFCEAHDFLFCGMCGTLLSFDSLDFAECPLCGFKRAAKDIEGRETQYTITAEDIRRELKIEPFVVLEITPIDEEVVQRAVVNESCPQCHHPQLEYYTRQLRSADEGQTFFYECPECSHKFSVNTRGKKILFARLIYRIVYIINVVKKIFTLENLTCLVAKPYTGKGDIFIMNLL